MTGSTHLMRIACDLGCACQPEIDRLRNLAGLSEARRTLDYDLRGKYAHYNALLFDCSLPEDLPIDWMTSKRMSGVVTFSVTSATMKVDLSSMRMKINNLFKANEQRLDSTLIHEMIHVYFIVKGEWRENHGPGFRAMARRLSERVGFGISLTDDVSDLALTDTAAKPIGVILITDRGGSGHSVIVASDKLVRAKTAEIEGYWSRNVGFTCDAVSIWTIADEAWTRYAARVTNPRSFARAAGTYRLRDQDLLAILTRDGTKIADISAK